MVFSVAPCLKKDTYDLPIAKINQVTLSLVDVFFISILALTLPF